MTGALFWVLCSSEWEKMTSLSCLLPPLKRCVRKVMRERERERKREKQSAISIFPYPTVSIWSGVAERQGAYPVHTRHYLQTVNSPMQVPSLGRSRCRGWSRKCLPRYWNSLSHWQSSSSRQTTVRERKRKKENEWEWKNEEMLSKKRGRKRKK